MTRAQPRLRICGDWSATTGLAHAARRLALALLNAGADLAVSEFRSGAPQEGWLYPEELRALVDDHSREVNLWTLNINEFHLVPDAELASSSLQYNIATWFWELPTIPAWMHPQFDRIDEIWAPSRFVQRTMSRYTSKPVRVLPPVVPIFTSDSSGLPRDRLGIRGERTVFLASFDFNSAVSRKNPMGVVEAFQRAFPHPSETGPVLIVKAINLHPDSGFTQRLHSALRAVGGNLVNRSMPSSELADLFVGCDVYVSLHRSEGFGLGLAEAMAIGKPVIGTAYSGNLDFMNVDNSCLVGYSLREIDSSDHSDNPGIEGTYIAGALWAEPDLDDAAAWMELLNDDSDLRDQVGDRGRKTLLGDFSEEAIARRATQFIDDIRVESSS